MACQGSRLQVERSETRRGRPLLHGLAGHLWLIAWRTGAVDTLTPSQAVAIPDACSGRAGSANRRMAADVAEGH